MTEVVVSMGNCQHPDNPFQWRLSPEAMESFAEQAPGQVVMLDYDPARPVGRVVGARVEGDSERLVLTLDLADERLLEVRSVGPAFVTDLGEGAVSQQDIDAIRLGHTTIKRAQLFGFGILTAKMPNDPRRGGAMDPNGKIYEAPEDEIPAADKARLEGYLLGRDEEAEAAEEAQRNAFYADRERQKELRERKEQASRLLRAEAKVPARQEGK